MWTTKTGGWPRYINTNLAGLYRLVFGINEVKGVSNSDFKFIPNKKPEKPVVPDATAASANDQEPLNRCVWRL
jgi:Uma2 family endonuclease